MKFPSEKELKRVRKLLANSIGSRILPDGAPPQEQIKNQICQQFVIHLRNSKLTQREMAKIVGIDEALMSKILHYHFDEFTIDRLIGYLTKIYPRVELQIKVA